MPKASALHRQLSSVDSPLIWETSAVQCMTSIPISRGKIGGNIIVTNTLPVHHIWSPNSVTPAPAPKEMRQKQQAVRRMCGGESRGRHTSVNQNSRLSACSWSVIRSARACVGGTGESWQWSGRHAARRPPPCRRRRTSEPLRSETETSISRDRTSRRSVSLISLGLRVSHARWPPRLPHRQGLCMESNHTGSQSSFSLQFHSK